MAVLRLDKFLSQALCESRNDVKKYIKASRVRIDGDICTKSETKIDTEINEVFFDFGKVAYSEFVYFMLNKPAGVVSAVRDEKYKTVVELLDNRDRHKGIFPVGRLDKDTTGLLILTNDGRFAHNTLSPKKHIPKTYYAGVNGRIEEDTVKEFKNGAVIIDKNGERIKLKSAFLNIILSSDTGSECEVTISEGKFHQIKKMFAAQNVELTCLKRIKFGDIALDECLKEGEYRRLNEREMEYVNKLLQ